MANFKNEKTTSSPLSLNAIFKGLLAALIITVLGSALLGIIYYVTSIGETTLPLTSSILYYISIFAGSVLAARWAGCKGLVHGIGVALLFMLLSWLIGHFLLHTSLTAGVSLQKAVISCLAGAVGGVLGVGFSR
ncbi:hypothetical protein SPSYN_02452 [Sporotomaculum syntrophicum]|uniref:Membrane protein (TIGR04086 family) n=1 Tax=Sporotomaculum syntrophicum TaxID=182264 RepID=A0A9D3AYE0_9FIRM|nr:TIGR04086 family membrane protein [Sporotomaculum syntrophicum]KAF1084673.1 hypothetical protein SPSYN_02452 [Sporotomaculum syntrophicum]